VAAPRFRTVQLDDIEPVPVLQGQLLWRPLRATLGVRAFGVNAYTARAAGDLVVEEHDESGSGAGGHEELYVVVAGRATFQLDGEEVDAPAGTAVFVRDPSVRRYAKAAEPGTTVLAVGGKPGSHEISGWEYSFAAYGFLAQDQIELGLAVLREGSEVVLFLYGIVAGGTSGSELLLGSLLGLAAGATFTGLTYLGLLAIPARYIFKVTTLLITLLAAGMAAQAVKFLDQAGLLTALGETLWDTSAWLPQNGILGSILHALIGYSEQPTVMQVIVYLGVLAGMAVLMRVATPAHPLRSAPSAR